VPQVAHDWGVPTYGAARLLVDTRGFAGVRFLIGGGMGLPLTATTVSLRLGRPRLLHEDDAVHPPEHLRFRLGPGAVSIALETARLARGTVDTREPMTLRADLGREEDLDAYVNVLRAALAGDSSVSERAPGITAAWSVVEPLLHADIPVHPYADGSFGPEAADRLLTPGERWYDPPPAP
jgi:glucose-6-phosphate 1-dehydrogenase